MTHKTQYQVKITKLVNEALKFPVASCTYDMEDVCPGNVWHYERETVTPLADDEQKGQAADGDR